MKNFCIIVLCISLSIASILFSLNGRYKVTMNSGDLGGTVWCRVDSLTGRAWFVSLTSEDRTWTEIRSFGYAFTKPSDNKE